MIFFDHFKVPTIKFGKCFAEFMVRLDIFYIQIEEKNMCVFLFVYSLYF